MKNYYFNPKSQDIYIFDPQLKDMLVLERIEGIRVITSSEIERPADDDGIRTHGREEGRLTEAGERRRATRPRVESGAPAAPNASKKVRLCKVCGKPGRTDYHEKQGMHTNLANPPGTAKRVDIGCAERHEFGRRESFVLPP